MSSQSVLITGVSGHIGFRVLTEALTAGHHVYAVLRKESQITKISHSKCVQPYLSKLKFFLIPDLTAPGAFDAVSDKVWAIIHVASPTFSGSGDVNVANFASTAWKITQNILDFATKTPSVKRVVITSSISAITPFFNDKQQPTEFYSSRSPISIERLQSQPDTAPEPLAYVLSKIYVAEKVRQYMELGNLGFSVVNVIPGTTVGPNELASTPGDLLAGSNTVALGPLLGMKFSPIPSIISHIADVSIAHIKALEIAMPGGASSSVLPVFNSKMDPAPFEWDDSIQTAKENFPEVVASGMFPFGGNVPVARLLADSTEDEELLGMKFKGYREAVVDLIRQYVQLASVSS